MPTNVHDDLFDQWGSAFNVNPQLAKSVFQMESGGGTTNPRNPMGIQPATAVAVAKQMGWDAAAVDVSDMRWAVPIAMRVMADGLNKTQSAEGALGYYSTGSTDPKRWNPAYIATVQKIYPTATLAPAAPQGAQGGQGDAVGATPPPTTQAAPATSQAQQPPAQAEPYTPGGPWGKPGPLPAPIKTVPVTSSSGAAFNVAPEYAPQFQGFLKDLEAAGYKIGPGSGGYNPRMIAGTNMPSAHAYGAAIDINPAANRQGGTQQDMPANVADIAEKYGLYWGGLWSGKSRDPMHFEIAAPAAAPQPGDVLVQRRGGRSGVATGHVAEGSGKRYFLMQVDDPSGKVAYSWEPAQSLVVRRAPQPSQQAAN